MATARTPQTSLGRGECSRAIGSYRRRGPDRKAASLGPPDSPPNVRSYEGTDSCTGRNCYAVRKAQAGAVPYKKGTSLASGRKLSELLGVVFGLLDQRT